MSVLTDERRLLLKELFALPGREILNRTLDLDDPQELIQELPCEDFFWLVKKVGEEDSLALLELASVDQWQYLLDMEIWERDRLDISHTSHWMSLLQQAHCRKLLRRHSLITLFRVGFGMGLKLKWEAERWLKGSWFYRQGLDSDFWGEHRGGILKGILAKRPRYYVGPGQKEEYRDFEWLSELDESRKILHRLMGLDKLIEQLAKHYPMDKRMLHSAELTFYPLLFNLWARLLLKMESSFSGVSLEQAKSLLSKLRGRSGKPPYRMTGFKRIFVRDFMTYAAKFDPETANILTNTLFQIWEKFREEFEYLSIIDLDGRYSKFVTIHTAH